MLIYTHRMVIPHHTGRVQKSSAPRCFPPDVGSGRINAPHGTELYRNRNGTKNANGKLANLVAYIKWKAVQR